MSGFIFFARKKASKTEYAKQNEFAQAFECDRLNLRRLALLLTGSTGGVDICVTRALQECVASSFVSRDWIAPWARRAIIRSAIELEQLPGNERPLWCERLADNDALVTGLDISTYEILRLPQLDRYVFVICALENYSIQDCALLMGKPPKIIFEALQRTVSQKPHLRDHGDRTLQSTLP